MVSIRTAECARRGDSLNRPLEFVTDLLPMLPSKSFRSTEGLELPVDWMEAQKRQARR